MKNLNYIIVLLISLFFTSCEDVIDVDLPTGETKLVIDASINWQLNTSGNQQTILLSTTTGYYEPTVPKVSGAIVFVTNSDTNIVYDFTENPGTGAYICTTFEPVLNANYELTVIYQGENFTATEKMTAVVPIDKVEQENDFFGGDIIKVNAFFTDNGASDDFYMFKFKPSYSAVPSYRTSNDEFFQGNQFSTFYASDELKSGDTVAITIYGTSEQFSNYMRLLLDITGGGGPFSTAPAQVKGNITNKSNYNNRAYGFFRLSQIDEVHYIIE